MTSHTCPDCMRGLPCERQPVESSLSRVVADAVNGPNGPFMAPVYFGHQRTDSEWKRDTFPQETM